MKRTMCEEHTVRNNGGCQYGDHLDSASLELSTTASIISYEEYFPYGDTSFIAGTNQKEVKLKEYRYTGKEKDDVTGLYYYGARYYASWLGRWMSADPLFRENPSVYEKPKGGSEDEQKKREEEFRRKLYSEGLNLYGYVKGNPVKLIDPSGREAKKDEKSINQVKQPVEKEVNKMTGSWASDDPRAGLGVGRQKKDESNKGSDSLYQEEDKNGGINVFPIKSSEKKDYIKIVPNSGYDVNHGGYKDYKAVDIGMTVGTNIYSYGKGTIVRVNDEKGFGKVIIVRYETENHTKDKPEYLFVLYAHNEDLLGRKEGQTVEAGELLVKSGKSSGGLWPRMGPHTHMEARIGASPLYDKYIWGNADQRQVNPLQIKVKKN